MNRFEHHILSSPSQSTADIPSLRNSSPSLPSPPLNTYNKTPAAFRGALKRSTQTPTPKPDQQMASTNTQFLETFYGYVKNRMDALLLIEACIDRVLFPLNVTPVDLSRVRIRSGTVLVFAENSSHSMMVRWRDGERWSPSRIHGQFLLYREVISTRHDSNPNGEQPETCTRFSTSGARANTRLVPNGFAKRTITLTGSDGNRYRVISYFYPSDVSHLYGDEPGTVAPPSNRGARDHRAIPEGVTLLTPAQNPDLKRYASRIDKEYVDGASGECLADLESVGSPAPTVIMRKASNGGIAAGSGVSVSVARPGSHVQHQHQHNQLRQSGPGPSNTQHHLQRQHIVSSTRAHPYAREQEARRASPRLSTRNACVCGGLCGRKWWDYNPAWMNTRPILAPLVQAQAFQQYPSHGYQYQGGVERPNQL
ncbi:Gti1/Pac2 family-domain-containing protein [Chytriomyces sp. MP71]|nr:Gti1/Pac2 family-domain-containing protein [Chytriomyces sp. MP71]